MPFEDILTDLLFSRGSKPHKSHKDPSDPQDVISIRLLDEGDSRIETIHVHEDGSVKRK